MGRPKNPLVDHTNSLNCSFAMAMNGQVAKLTYKKEKENVGGRGSPHQYHLLRVEAISWVLYFRILIKESFSS